MSEMFSKVEVITGVARRRRFTIEQKTTIIAEMMQPGVSMSYIARRHGLSEPFNEGGRQVVRADDDVVPAFEARRVEEKLRELERLLGRKTMEVEILEGGAGPRPLKKTDLAVHLCSAGRFPMRRSPQASRSLAPTSPPASKVSILGVVPRTATAMLS